MKKTILASLLFFAAISAFAQVKPEGIMLSVQKGKFSLNKNNLSDKWLMAPAVKVLRFAEREKDGYNKTHSYDRFGIVLFESMEEKKPSGKLAEFQVYFSEPEEANSIAATGYFKGNFTIGSMKLHKDLSADELQEKLVAYGYKKTESYMEHNFRYSKDGLYIYFLYDQAELRLIKVSVGKDMRKDEE